MMGFAGSGSKVTSAWLVMVKVKPIAMSAAVSPGMKVSAPAIKGA